MSKTMITLATAGVIAAGPVAAASAAPSTPAPSSPSASASPATQTVVKHEKDKSGLWGLLGLLGLAGLIPRKKQVNVQPPRRVENTEVRHPDTNRVGNAAEQGRDRLAGGDDLRR